MKKTQKKTSFFILCFSILLLQACYQNQEGCLDVAATNFDVEADIDCCQETATCCCTYPSLSLSILHKLTADAVTNFNTSSTLTLMSDSSQSFIVENIQFYLTNFHLINSNTATEVGVEDQITLYNNNNGQISSQEVEDNFSLIKPSQFTYDIGTFLSANNFDMISFDVGLSNSFNNTIVDSLSSDHALADTTQLGLDGYISNQINIRIDTTYGEVINNTNPNDLFETNISPFGNVSTQQKKGSKHFYLDIKDIVNIKLPLNQAINSQLGFNTSINLRINHLEWYQGINFVTDNHEQIVNKIVDNTTNVFQISE